MVKISNSQLLTDYEFKLWNFSCFDIESSLWVKTAFYAGKYAFAADYIRAYALYNYGGILILIALSGVAPNQTNKLAGNLYAVKTILCLSGGLFQSEIMED